MTFDRFKVPIKTEQEQAVTAHLKYRTNHGSIDNETHLDVRDRGQIFDDAFVQQVSSTQVKSGKQSAYLLIATRLLPLYNQSIGVNQIKRIVETNLKQCQTITLKQLYKLQEKMDLALNAALKEWKGPATLSPRSISTINGRSKRLNSPTTAKNTTLQEFNLLKTEDRSRQGNRFNTLA